MKRKAMFDIEDLIWYVAFVLILVLILIIISVPGCKDKLAQRLSVAGNELEKSVASQELNDALSAKMPGEFKTLSDSISSDSAKKAGMTFDNRLETKDKILKYLEANYKYIGGKSFAEFIGYMYYDRANIAKMGPNYPNAIFSAVTFGLFSRPACKYPATATYSCINADDRYESPVILAQSIADPDDFALQGDYLFNAQTISPDLVKPTAVNENIPLPDSSMALVILSRSNEASKK
jgi:hypothetical protein